MKCRRLLLLAGLVLIPTPAMAQSGQLQSAGTSPSGARAAGGYKDISESSNLEVGGSYARGHNDAGSDFVTSLYATDLTFRWKPLQRAIYRSFITRSELMWSRREEPALAHKAFGIYGSAEYQILRRWFAAGRFDWAERACDANIRDHGLSAVLTYWPSEFSQVRGQYRRTRLRWPR